PGVAAESFRESLFDLRRLAWQRRRQYFGAVFGPQAHVFNPDADVLIRNVDAWLDADHHAFFEGGRGIGGIMDFQADVMADAVRKIFAQWLVVQILVVGIDVLVCHLVETARRGAPESHPGLYRGDDGLLRAQHD